MLVIKNYNNRVDKLENALSKYSLLGNIPARNEIAKLLTNEYNRTIKGLKSLDTHKILYKTHHHIIILYDDVENLIGSYKKKIKNLNKLVDGTF